MEDLADPKKDREAVRLRRKRTRWTDIARQLGYPEHAWLGIDAIMAYHRGTSEPITREEMRGWPPAYQTAAKRWNKTLAEQEPPAA